MTRRKNSTDEGNMANVKAINKVIRLGMPVISERLVVHGIVVIQSDLINNAHTKLANKGLNKAPK
ncbi:hypothetical protein [Vibrio sonorensis]|uniref:hypothetical protein n=1 Tax=Vibrio sonorensis TaxID=1004316 RepID=UPI0011145BF4|nr:hypothetical protein [Vibrio sonorensis]